MIWCQPNDLVLATPPSKDDAFSFSTKRRYSARGAAADVMSRRLGARLRDRELDDVAGGGGIPGHMHSLIDRHDEPRSHGPLNQFCPPRWPRFQPVARNGRQMYPENTARDANVRAFPQRLQQRDSRRAARGRCAGDLCRLQPS
jgi:hypothetical protein